MVDALPQVRAMTEDDLDQIMDIERDAHPEAWERHVFESTLKDPFKWRRVATNDDGVIGFVIVQREPDHGHIVNLAVARAWRRRGIATRLLEYVETLARAAEVSKMMLEVRETNLPAQLLYRDAGYRATEILKRHYEMWDGYRMMKLLDEPAEELVDA